jgi:hypothetical protein
MHGENGLHGAELAYVFSCVPFSSFERGRLVGTTRGEEGRQTFIVGVVPDGINNVVVNVGDGHAAKILVRHNVYAAYVPTALAVTFDQGGTLYTVPLVQDGAGRTQP